HCAIVETAAHKGAAAAFTRSGFAAQAYAGDLTVIEGFIDAADAECVTVTTRTHEQQRVAVDLAPMDFLGKHATIWAERTEAARCGGLVMASAVYAEPAR
ncbi:MAG: hypothetical protein KAH44_06965, partial [Oricola sp.]|nr:hypothetical protein [Oricola sp.]